MVRANLDWCLGGPSTDTKGRLVGRVVNGELCSVKIKAVQALTACVLSEITTVSQDINVLALVKGEEKYIFLYDDDNRSETLRMLGRYASNSSLSFSWYDAAVLSQKVRKDDMVEHEQQMARQDAPHSGESLPSDLFPGDEFLGDFSAGDDLPF